MDAYSQVADEQLDDLERSDPALYDAALTICEHIGRGARALLYQVAAALLVLAVGSLLVSLVHDLRLFYGAILASQVFLALLAWREVRIWPQLLAARAATESA